MRKSDYTYNICEMRIKYSTKVPAKERIRITDSSKLAEVFYRYFDSDSIELTEIAYAIITNNNMCVLGIINIGVGCMDNSVMDMSKAIQAALLCNGKAIAICHNHPSGTLKPSTMDDKTTSDAKKMCDVMKMRLIDHRIINADGDYYSYNDNGLL